MGWGKGRNDREGGEVERGVRDYCIGARLKRRLK